MNDLKSDLLTNSESKPIHFLTLLDTHNVNLICKRLANKNKWICDIEKSWIKRNSALEGIYGEGSNPEEAAKHYLKQILGRTVIIDFAGRIEFVIPSNTYL